MKPSLKPGRSHEGNHRGQPRVINFMGDDCRVYATRASSATWNTPAGLFFSAPRRRRRFRRTKVNWSMSAALLVPISRFINVVGVDGRP